MVLALGFGGGWVAGALGLGGGVIFNPMLMSLGVPPKVSSATGMYMITFSKIATCTIYFVNGKLILNFQNQNKTALFFRQTILIVRPAHYLKSENQ